MANDKKEVLRLRTWYSNRYQLMLVQKKILSIFSMFAMVSVVIAVIFVKKFTESKSFEPYVVELEEKTGLLSVVENITNTRLTADESIKRFYLKTFLDVSEGYNYTTYAQDRRKAFLLSETNVYRNTAVKYSQRSENSVPNMLGANGSLTIKIKSIIFLRPTLASVRYVIYSTRPSALYPKEKHLIANIEFEFVDMKLSQEDRFVNPLGFRVTKYSYGEDVNL
jgi:type IV secretion system protein VirB8